MTADDVFDKKNAFVDSVIEKQGNELATLQRRLLDSIIDDIASGFDLGKGNTILRTPKNIRLLSKIDKVYDDFSKAFLRDATGKFASGFLDLTNFNRQYFSKLGVKESTLDKVMQGVKSINDSLGIEVSGKKVTVKEGGYLAGITESPEVRNQLKRYTLESINSGATLREFTSGMRELVEGAQGKDGLLQSYWQQYAYDTYSIIDRAQNVYIGDQLKLRCFVYSGGNKMKTSRPFCKGGYDKVCGCTFKPKIGKVFIASEFEEEFQNVDFQGKMPGKIMTNLGGYNCRHTPKFITDEMAIRLDPTIQEKLK